ncbi:unnamed protein product [Danaus chrysippus]|uniref:(African queen) hypothetical protein n=1 Tax=Danaus chrysippus TaxID=151541 RepID=A0A8J2QK89_9NEOP|nr:unnamed protein product [Danaus chrysippus]
MIGAQSNRVGLGSNRKVQDADILKSFIRQDENDKYKIHAMNLEMQNEWLDIGDLCIPLALKWRTLIYDWSPALLKFYLNAFQMTLPDQSNLVRGGKSTENTCYICGKAVGTAKHLLVGCKVLLDSGQYSRRHDRVLEVIREAVSLSVARAQKEITTNERSVGFVREGTRATKSNVKPYSILKAASDWTIMMETYEKQYKIPEDICVSASRPDIFLFSQILKRVVMIELTVPWETNIPKDHTIKVNKYYELTNELTRNRFVVDLYAVEVGARGITAKSLYNLLKYLGLSRTHINAFLERTSKAALVGSFQIWLGRERSLDSGGERITRVRLNAVKIVKVSVPEIIQYGVQDSVILDCDYIYGNNTSGLVVKWFFKNKARPVYQWIATQKPQDIGILRGRVDLTYRASNDPLKMHRALRIVKLNTDISGDYTCVVSTFMEEDSRTRQMIVFGE